MKEFVTIMALQHRITRRSFTDLVRLAEPYNLGEQVMLQSLLDGSGIEYLVRDAHMSSLYPGIPALTPQIFVHERDLPRAEHLLSRLRLSVHEVTDEAETN